MNDTVLRNSVLVKWGKPVLAIAEDPDGRRPEPDEIQGINTKAR
jgi:hypothetical protein